MSPYSSIESYHAHLQNGDITCVQAVHHYLAEIVKNKPLNCFLETFPEEALARADQLDKSEIKGKLHGVIIGIKDNICYKDHISSAGSRIIDNYSSLYSATAVEKLINEGAIIIGRQNCDEFGMGSTNENSAFGPVLNPINNDRVSGGSSGGSAAAIKAGLCMVSLGSDTGGSVRLPADFCGIIGLKPTYGRVSRHGLIAYGSSFDQIGILANTVEDVYNVITVISGPDNFDSTVEQSEMAPGNIVDKDQKYKIAYFPDWLNHASVDKEIKSQINGLIDTLQRQGHELLPVDFPLTDYIVPTYYILTTAEASSNLSRYDGVRYGVNKIANATDLTGFYKDNRSNGFGKEVKKRIMLGTFVLSAGYYEAYFTKAQQVRRQLTDHTYKIFKDFDFILSPTSPVTAPHLGGNKKDPLSVYMGDIFTVFANLTGIPAISLPLFKHSYNLPFGVQLMANRFNEVSLLRFSHQLMQQ